MNSHQKQLESLKAQISRLKKAASDNLGSGYWGLVTNNKFSHEEIIFLFSRIFKVLDFEHVNLIRTDFPDCIATKNGQEYSIEFEPYLSNFKDHITKKNDLSKCNYIICWEDDLEEYSSLKRQIIENKIEIIELKPIYEITKTKKIKKTYEWTKEDFERMKENKLKVLSAFITEGKSLLTTHEIGNIIGKESRGLGGSLKGFKEHKHREKILTQTPRGWKFNDKYRDMIKNVLNDFDMI